LRLALGKWKGVCPVEMMTDVVCSTLGRVYMELLNKERATKSLESIDKNGFAISHSSFPPFYALIKHIIFVME
jgi:hypothetical protein